MVQTAVMITAVKKAEKISVINLLYSGISHINARTLCACAHVQRCILKYERKIYFHRPKKNNLVHKYCVRVISISHIFLSLF